MNDLAHSSNSPPHHWHVILSGEACAIDTTRVIINSYFDHLVIVEHELGIGLVEICVPYYDPVLMNMVNEEIAVELLRREQNLKIEAREVETCQMRLI